MALGVRLWEGVRLDQRGLDPVVSRRSTCEERCGGLIWISEVWPERTYQTPKGQSLKPEPEPWLFSDETVSNLTRASLTRFFGSDYNPGLPPGPHAPVGHWSHQRAQAEVATRSTHSSQEDTVAREMFGDRRGDPERE